MAKDLSTADVQLALDRAHRVLWKSQKTDGSWDSAGEVGPWVTAQVVTVLRYLKRLNQADTEGAAKWLTLMQRPDGSFSIHPYSNEGDLSSTACGWAALHLCGATAPASRAMTWVLGHGGLGRVLQLMDEGNFAAVFLAMAGLLDPKELTSPMVAPLLVPGVESLLQRRFHSGVLMGTFELHLLINKLRGERSFIDPLVFDAARELLAEFQNQDGSWNDSTVISVLALPALDVINDQASQEMLGRALGWLEQQKIRDADGMHFAGFGTEVWATAFDLRALLQGGDAKDDADIRRGVQWLIDAQLVEGRAPPMPKVDNRKDGGVRNGGWAFQRTNHTMPDCDDAGVALSALGIARQRATLGAELDTKVLDSIRQGQDWLLSMQNPDGGWSAFVWGLPGKAPGPMMEKNAVISWANPFSMVGALIHPPPITGDPSTEDLTSRVLHGLAMTKGSHRTADVDAAMHRAIAFLRTQQCDNGAWWGRWVVNYLSASAFVLLGLKAAGVDFKETWVQRSIRFIFDHQNPDGGWGELPNTYADPTLAGQGPTMLPLTALVLQALLEAGLVDDARVVKAMTLLVQSQRTDGTWDNGQYLHTNVPPDTFYVYPEAARFYPTEVLGLWLQKKGVLSTAYTPRTKWNDALLDAARTRMDPKADEVVAKLFSSGSVDKANDAVKHLFRTDAPMPADLPQALKDFYDDVYPVPLNQADMKIAQALFARAGWQVATGLFCSALPQAYAAGYGAHALAQTQSMVRDDTKLAQRIFETAQFIFDVLAKGAFDAGGRGLRATQKVRLMHAGVRWLIKHRMKWDSALYGEPLNQEDLAGTLMTFSIVILDALRIMGVEVSEDEKRAYLSTWRTIGGVLGVELQLIPVDLADAEELMEAIRDRQWRRTDDGKDLARALMGMMQGYFPGTLLDGIPAALVRTLAGDHCAELLSVSSGDLTEWLVDLGMVIGEDVIAGADRKSAFFAWVRQMMMESAVFSSRGWKDAAFRIPDSLTNTVDPTG